MSMVGLHRGKDTRAEEELANNKTKYRGREIRRERDILLFFPSSHRIALN